MREIFQKYILRSQEDMQGYIQNDAESLTEKQQDELEALILKYDEDGCPDPLAWALRDIYKGIDENAGEDWED